MFWEKRKEKAAKYKVENENLAVPEIHLKGDDDADPAEVCGCLLYTSPSPRDCS